MGNDLVRPVSYQIKSNKNKKQNKNGQNPNRETKTNDGLTIDHQPKMVKSLIGMTKTNDGLTIDHQQKMVKSLIGMTIQ